MLVVLNFSKDKKGKYGLYSQCKECRSAYIKKYNKKYREENKEKIAKQRKKYDKKYYEKHKEELAKRSKIYREEHKEERAEYDKKRYKEHKEEKREYDKKYYQEHKEAIAEQKKKYNKTPQGQVVIFNGVNKRRQREEQQGNGITVEQWLEMMNFFDWKCAYSGEYIGGDSDNRTIDHIVPIVKGGEHEVWNCVPMYAPYNFSKYNKDMEEWYSQQDFYNEDRFNKINGWIKYAYNKWGNKVNT